MKKSREDGQFRAQTAYITREKKKNETSGRIGGQKLKGITKESGRKAGDSMKVERRNNPEGGNIRKGC